jgi:hypothetical protein
VKESPDERRFPIVYTARRGKTEQILLQVLLHEGLETESLLVRRKAH